MKIDKETLRSAPSIFCIYVIASSLFIMLFRFIFPGEAPPLPLFSRNWRLYQGLLDIFVFFPALAMSALVVPFGIAVFEDSYTRFSPQFFQRLFAPLGTAIFAAAIYGVIFFLALPLVRDARENMRYSGELYRLAKERAQTHIRAGEWIEASQFIRICDSVWPESSELENIRAGINIHIEENRIGEGDARAAARAGLAGAGQSAALSSMPGQRQPLSALEALEQGRTAFSEKRYFDAHWLATLAERIAKSGSPEGVTAARLAANAWNMIETQQPNAFEERRFRLYRLKQSGYEAMVSGDWIQAFYLFQELAAQTPDDPDAANFLAASEKGTRETSFFIDEVEVSLQEILTGAVFSLPTVSRNGSPGRAVLRVSSFSAAPDYAYGIGLDYMSFDAQSRPLFHIQAPFAKLLPFTVDGRHQVLVLVRALDRYNSSQRWEAELVPDAEGRTFSAGWRPGDAQIILDVSYEDFILLSKIRQGLPNMQINELFAISKTIGSFGYVPEVFEAEILNRLGAVLFFLPMLIIAIIVGWRFRAKTRVRYFFIILLPILPVVFNGLVHLYRILLNNLGIWLVLTMGFSAALGVFITILAGAFIASMIALAAQHG